MTLLICVFVQVGWTSSARALESSAGGSYEAWQLHRDSLLKDPSVVRYYTFEGFRDAGTPVANLAGKEGTLRLGAVGGSPEEQFTLIDGRFSEKKSVRLDRGFFYSEPFDVDEKSFTVEAWFRANGPGALRGDAIPTGGTLLSAGIGYWDGWRVTLLYPEKTIGLEIGRPAPVNAVSIRTDTIADRLWHHLAITWDGQVMSLYLDGLLAKSGPYSGDYYPPNAGAQFRVGYAGFGWGSTILDIDEVVVYKRALSSMEILRSAVFYESMSETLRARFASADSATAKQDYPRAAAEYISILGSGEAQIALQAVARLRLGEVLAAQNDNPSAFREFAKVLETQGLPEGLRGRALSPFLQLARQGASGAPYKTYELILNMKDLSPSEKREIRLNLARSYRQQKNYAAARDQYRRVLDMPDLSPREKLDLSLQTANTAVEARDFAGARAEYARIAGRTEIPAQYRSYLQLRIAQTCVRERNYSAAKAEYAKVQAIPDAPDHHIREAQECSREVDRLRRGVPARDPADSRVRLPKRPAPAAELYVAPEGSDSNPGTKQRPFATLLRAREAVRGLKRAGKLARGGVVVHLRPGLYLMKETFNLTAEDSGTANSPITYLTEGKGTVQLTGGTPISGFKPVENPAILARLPEESRGQVVQLDLKAQGITDYGEMKPRGMGLEPSPALELFFDGKPMQLGRWPNEGFVRTGKVLDRGAGPRGAIFQFDGDRPARWKQASDPWLFGFWSYLWADGTLDVASIDPQTRQFTTRHPYTYGGGLNEGMPYYAFNLLEEIDMPGEWYLDRTSGILYLYPPSDPAKAMIHLTMMGAPMIEMDEASYVTFQGLTLELGRSDGVNIKGGDHCLIAGCTLRQLGGLGVKIDGGMNHGVLSCDLHTLGRNGTWVKGGDRKTLTPGGHFVENCHIYDFSRLDRTYTPAVWMDGVGNRVAHNVFHESPCHALRLEGNDHVIEYNEIYHVLKESDDQGGLDMFLDPSYRGNVLRYNFWHDIGSGNIPCGQAGIRLDDAISGVLLYGNVFYRCSQAQFGGVQIHGGKENVVDNNVFVDCKYAVSFSGWGPDRWKQFLASDWVQKTIKQDVDITKPPYSTRYPALARLEENEGINTLSRNLVYNCTEFLTRDRGIQDLMENYITSDDPGFVDAKNLDFRLKSEASVYNQIGFRPIPFDEIGLYQDSLRPTWPAKDGKYTR
ncbi:MAG: right-handed parallel beta-helix repeat-containing protein [Armatimonadetes bacterium]|nr:right-handed parallel beta-helix repeat-containing protein [Armatimonadota bacterium]